jgi:c-di-GMP-binding flagellar brake protein YcgR
MLTLTEPMTRKIKSAEGAERRRGFRIQQTRPIKVFESTSGKYFGGQTQDISSTGLRIELPASMAFREGKIVSVHVGLSTQGQPLANRRQMIPARIVWVDRPTNTSARMMSAGIEFMASIAAELDAA